VVAENFAVGMMDRLGLGYESLKQLNPRLIYATGTGYGLTGPYSSYPAFDPVIQAMAGVMSTTGFPDGPPLKAGPAVMDIMGGIHLAAGILAALYQRDRTGEGTLVEVSIHDTAIPPLTTHIAGYLARGGMLVRSGITIIKYWFSVSDKEQERRFKSRIEDPTKRWKLSPMDLESRDRWQDYSRAKDNMLVHTDIEQARWYVVNSDNKKRAHLNCIAHLLSLLPYKDMTPKKMKLPSRKPELREGYERPPLDIQNFVPEIY